MISFFPEAEKSEHWPAIQALLQPAADLGGIDPKEDGDLIWLALEGGKVWAAFTVRLANRVLEIRCAGGTKLWAWLEPFEAAMTAFGKDCSAARLELRGRRGWSRWARKLGWNFDRYEDGKPVWIKELAYGRR